VHGFIARTHDVVPQGEESVHLRLDDMISQLLAD
jgi:hypothetical protein